MSTTFIQPGDVMEFTAPTGGVTAGVLVVIGGLPVIPTTTTTAGTTFRGKVAGVVTLLKTTGETWTEQQPIYWDAANGKASNDSQVGFLPIGQVSTGGAASGDASGPVRLNGVSLGGRLFTRRLRLAVATINAGATNIAPAIPGVKWRLVDEKAIAIGGNAGAVTTVDVIATQGASGVKLVAHAQASLTRSAVLRAGDAASTVLADGASFMVNDVNTAIQVSKTGASITTSTAIDVEIEFALEA